MLSLQLDWLFNSKFFLRSAPPVICGTNSGQHMYVHASPQCNVLNANFGSSSTATSSAFTIKITQVLCSSKLKAPQGCLQYFTGTTGTITTYNYNSGGGVLLTNQDYSICLRSISQILTAILTLIRQVWADILRCLLLEHSIQDVTARRR